MTTIRFFPVAPRISWLHALLFGPGVWAAPDSNRQELLTGPGGRDGEHQRADNSYRAMPNRPPLLPVSACMLVVGASSEAKDILQQHCASLPPGLETEYLPSFSDAVLRMARGGVDLVVLDLRSLPALSPAASLMLRGLAPDARVLALGASGAGTPQGVETLRDELALATWLLRHRAQA